MRLAVLLYLLGCTDTSDKDGAIDNDADRDGWVGAADCDDEDFLVGGPSLFFEDADEDGFGGPTSVSACEAPAGHVANALDCDDSNPEAYPGALEIWYDDIDQDCLGGDDFDQDSDGFALSDDCNDEDPAIHPGAPDEPYDGLDTDCSGGSDYDQDADGFDADTHGGDDCDDADAEVHPAAEEVWYDGLDQDCDGTDDDQDGDGYLSADDCNDEDALLHTQNTYYIDCDNDSYYAPVPVLSCGPPDLVCDGGPPASSTTLVPSETDCDDHEVQQGPAQDWWLDCDDDGQYAEVPVSACGIPAGLCAGGDDPPDFTSTDPGLGDCNDADDTATQVEAWFVDCDGDGAYAAVSQPSCGTPVLPCDGLAAAATTSIDPGAYDCDDADASGSQVEPWYVDCDGDGSYAATPADSCGIPDDCAGTRADPQSYDCDDTRAAYSEEGTWYVDCDGDGALVGLDSLCNPEQVVCFDQQPPDAFQSTDPGTYDCDDRSVLETTPRVWWIDCDGDGYSVATESRCDPSPATTVCASGQPPVAAVPDDPGKPDCDDDAVGFHTALPWWYDCDGDFFFAPHSGICNPSVDTETCASGSPPRSFADKEPLYLDCDDSTDTTTDGESWWLDCDGDGAYRLVPRLCDGVTDTSTCADGLPAEDATLLDPEQDDCDDESADYTERLTYWFDCDGDAALARQDEVCNPTIDASRCEDGLPPDGFATLAPAEEDCDDADASYEAVHTWYLDCDGDDAFAQGAELCNPTRDPCPAGPAAGFVDVDPGSYDCDDDAVAFQSVQSWWLDCDGDGSFADTPGICNPTVNEGSCADGEAPDDRASDNPNAESDCDDSHAAFQHPETYWLDCDGDTWFLDVPGICNPTTETGHCPDGEVADAFDTTNPQADPDCDDDNALASVVKDWWIDCDGDSVYADAPVSECFPSASCDGEAAVNETDSDPVVADCDDFAASFDTVKSWRVDCDGDTAYVDQDACNPTVDEGYCFDAAAPDAYLESGGADDCDDADVDSQSPQDWYVDCDGDGAFAATPLTACSSTGLCDGGDPANATLVEPNDFDCSDEAPNYAVLQSWWLDCDGDGYYVDTPEVCDPTANEGDCTGDVAPAAFAETNPQTVPDCDDTAFDYTTAQVFWLDCDGDTWFVETADVCNPETQTDVCADESPADDFAESNPRGSPDCDDTTAAYAEEASWWLDCDGDGYYVDTAGVCDPSANEGDCATGEAPVAFAASDPQGSPDCDDDAVDYWLEQAWWLDCDGDAHYVSVSDVCNPTLDEGDCFDNAAPDAATPDDPGPDYDCDDEDALLTKLATYWFDCDGDSYYVETADVCDPEADEGDCFDNAPPDTYKDSAPAEIDCDDTSASYQIAETWWVDCDDDSVHAIEPLDACGSSVCNPDGATTTDPGVYDCFDDDELDLYCTDCEEILSSSPTAADGLWHIDADGSTTAPSFEVECDMTRGGWIVLAYTDTVNVGVAVPDTVFIASEGSNNHWGKCPGDQGEVFGVSEQTDGSDADAPLGKATRVFDVGYQDPSGDVTYSYDEEISALLGVVGEMWIDPGGSGLPTNRMVALVSDDDNGAFESDGNGGHEVYVCGFTGTCDDSTGFLLSRGESGNCTSGIGASAVWRYHTHGAEQKVSASLGQVGALAPRLSTGLTLHELVPAQVALVVDTGGGVAFGWEQPEIRLRAARYGSCLEAYTEDFTRPDGIYPLDPDGPGGEPALLLECDMSNGGWTVIYDEDFEDLSSAWHDGTDGTGAEVDTTVCGTRQILGGYEVAGAGDSLSESLSTLGIPHTQLGVGLDYWVIDSWDDERASVYLDGTEVWFDTFSYTGSSDLCGRDGAAWFEQDVGPVPVKRTIAHSDDSVILRATSGLDTAPVDESFGIDNVLVKVR